MNYFLILTIVIFLIVAGMFIEHRRMKKIALERGKPNICKFAREFDYRNIDTQILREVWNELQLTIGEFEGEAFPIEANDFFESTYHLDEDDLDDVYWSVCDRLGIETENAEKNPYFEKVTSVKTLVLFIHNQPRTNNA